MSKKMIDRLVEERQKAWHEGKELLDAADAENRDLSGEEETKWESINTSLDDLDKRLKALVDSEKRQQAAEELRGEIDNLARPTDAGNRDDNPTNDSVLE